MKKNTKEIGSIGEDIAIDYLKAQGYNLLERNWLSKKYKGYEIDLIMTKGVVIVFIEVKYRRQGRFGYSANSITEPKKKRLYEAAEEYLITNAGSQFTNSSFGAVFIDDVLGNRVINFVENIFI